MCNSLYTKHSRFMYLLLLLSSLYQLQHGNFPIVGQLKVFYPILFIPALSTFALLIFFLN